MELLCGFRKMKNKWEFDVRRVMIIRTAVPQNLVQHSVPNQDLKKTWFLLRKSNSSNLLQKCAHFCWASMGKKDKIFIEAKFELEEREQITVVVNSAYFGLLKGELPSENVPSEEVRELAGVVVSTSEELLFTISRG